jgi:Bax protein
MKIKSLLLFVLLLVVNESFSQKNYIKKYKAVADSFSTKYEIPSSVILGVAIVESGYGKSRSARLLNNHFGIVGKNDLFKTKGIKSRYKQFKNVTSSFETFCKIVSRKKLYKQLKGNENYLLWIDAISKSGYTEAPIEWKKNVLGTIKKINFK